jgi:tRNA nucleotidyltransferase/poly(A) polymerase
VVDIERVKSACAGRPIYVVGGAIRDLLLGRVVHDIDLAVPGSVRDTAEMIAQAVGGNCFRAGTRADIYRVNLPGSDTLDLAPLTGTIEADLRRRDFTINAMGALLESFPQGLEQSLIDPYGGQNDLKDRVLRRVTPDAFVDDPVRLLRLVRFQIELGFGADIGAANVLKPALEHLADSPGERLHTEICRLFTGASPSRAANLMEEYGITAALFPEVAAEVGVTQNVHHQFDVLEHSRRVFRAFNEIWNDFSHCDSSLLGVLAEWREGLSAETVCAYKIAAFLHDIGKPPTRKIRQERVTFYGHEMEGEKMSELAADRLRLSRDNRQTVGGFIRYHMYPAQLARAGQTDDGYINRFFTRVPGDLGVVVALFSLADALGKKENAAETPEFAALQQAINRFLHAYFERNSEVISPPQLVDGDGLQRHFNRGAGPWIKSVLAYVREQQAAGRVSTREQALAAAAQAPAMRDEDGDQRLRNRSNQRHSLGGGTNLKNR